MTVQDIEKLKRPGTEQTWEETFKGIDETSEKFDKLVAEFVEFVGEWKDFSEVRRDRLADYIVDLGKIQDHWEDINVWIEENSASLGSYAGSLTDIRDLFQEIASEASGARRQTTDRVSIVRNLARLANENLVMLKQEGGLTESGTKNLLKRANIKKNEFEAQLKIITGQKDLSSLTVKDWNVVEAQEQAALNSARHRIAELSSQRRLTEGEKARLKILRDEEKQHVINLEYLNNYNRLAVDGLVDRIETQQKYLREQRLGGEAAEKNAVGANKVSAVSKAMKRFGMNEEANELTRDYGNFITRRVEAKLNVDEAQKKVTQQQGVVKQAKASVEDLQKQKSYEDVNVQVKSNSLLDVLDRLESAKNRLPVDFNREANRPYDKATGKFITEEEFARYKKLRDEVSLLEGQYEKINQELIAAKNNQKSLNSQVEAAKRNLAAEIENEVDLQNQATKAVETKNLVFDKTFDLSGKIVKYFKEGVLHLGKWGGPLGAALALATAIFRQLLKFDEEAVKTKRVIGQWADASALANTKFVTGTEVLKTMRALGEQFYINPVQVFDSQELARITQAQKLTGMTAEAAGNLAVQSKISGKNADTYRDAIAKGANAANAQNHAAVNLSVVQNDILQTSRAIALSYGNGTERLAKAASTAASLGMNLQQVEDISKNLMNFELSIQSEMQAQLLTGMQLNLAKAREYALNNDLEGVTREISNQGMNAAKFSHMNYIQQENMAKALGMSREQMSKMLIMQELNSGLTAKQVAAMTGMRRQDIEALSAQEKWQTMKQRFLEALVPLLYPVLQVVTDLMKVVTPIIGIVSTIAGWVSKLLAWIVTAGDRIAENNMIARALMGSLVIGLGLLVSRAGLFGKALAGSLRLVSKIGGAIGTWAAGILKAKTAEEALNTATPKAGKGLIGRLKDRFSRKPTSIANQAGNVAKGPSTMGKAVGSLGKNMGNILKGAAAAILIAGAVFILAKAAQEFMKVSWSSIAKATVGMLALVGMVALLGAIMSSGIGTVLILAGAAAMVVLAGATALLGIALRKFNEIEWKTIGMLPVALLALAAAGMLALAAGPTLLLGSVALMSAIPGLTVVAGALSLVARPLSRAADRISESFAKLSAIKFQKPDLSEIKEFAAELKDVSEELNKANVPVKFSLQSTLSRFANRIKRPVASVVTSVDQVAKAVAKPSVEVPTETSKENKEIQRENIEASVQDITIKQAQVQANAQKFTVEQKAADLSRIERKMDAVIKTIEQSRPDWDWLKFGTAMSRNTPFMSSVG